MVIIAIKKKEKRSFNSTQVTGGLNSSQALIFTYDALNRLTSASTNGVGQGQFQQDYQYDPATGNLNYRTDVGNYVYYPDKPHAVTNAGGNIYVYDFNGNMVACVVVDVSYVLWEYTYDAENRLVQIDRDGLVVNRYIYDGDGNRVARLGLDNRGTVFIGNYFEAVYPHNIIPDPPPLVTEGGGEENEPSIGRFMQADTIVPPTQGTQAFDRYAYVNNCPSVNSEKTPAWAIVIVTSASPIHRLNAVGSLRSQIHAIRFRGKQFYRLWMIVRSKLKKVSPAAVHARRVSAGPSEPLLE